MTPITWRTETKPLKWFKPWERNPRILTDKGMSDLGDSIDRFGLAEPIIANTDGTVIGGHARLQVLKGRKEAEALVMLPNRKLTAQEVEELNIRLNANTAGVWDWDKLANEWDAGDLNDWGLVVPMTPADSVGEQPGEGIGAAKVCPHCGGEL